MAEYGEWNRKGATLSDVTAQKEYGVSRDFIVRGIQTGRLLRFSAFHNLIITTVRTTYRD